MFMDTTQRKELASVFAEIDDADTMMKFFGEMFTEAEQKDITLRWQLMKKLNANLPQREIASKLGISLCKITRGAKIVKDSDSVTSKIMNKKI